MFSLMQFLSANSKKLQEHNKKNPLPECSLKNLTDYPKKQDFSEKEEEKIKEEITEKCANK